MKRIPIEDLINYKYGRLVILSDDLSHTGRHRKVICLCDCGNKLSVMLLHLKSGHTNSCGCYNKEKCITHGLRNHPIYNIWDGMKQRCHNPNNPGFKDYGARGIIVCEEWRNDFKSFFDWALTNGWEMGLENDRIDVNGNYEPSNCRFVTPSINARNKRITKLNPEQVQNILSLRKEKGWGRKKIADELGLTVGSVGGVIYQNTWGGLQ